VVGWDTFVEEVYEFRTTDEYVEDFLEITSESIKLSA
jgi:hypothetical protein